MNHSIRIIIFTLALTSLLPQLHASPTRLSKPTIHVRNPTNRAAFLKSLEEYRRLLKASSITHAGPVVVHNADFKKNSVVSSAKFPVSNRQIVVDVSTDDEETFIIEDIPQPNNNNLACKLFDVYTVFSLFFCS